MNKITITRPDDWHLHLRDGDALKAVLPDTARRFARAIVMPNLRPPVTNVRLAIEYRQRILECVEDLAVVLGGECRITIARELTKTFETFHRCALFEAKAWLESDANQQKGEFVLLVEASPAKEEAEIPAEAERILRLLLADLPLKQAVKLATEVTGVKKNILYEFALKLKDE